MTLSTSGILRSTVNTASLDGLLNQVGRDGWELVEMLHFPGELKRGEVVAVFKRPAPQPKDVSDHRGTCPQCHYDLRGADHDVCPECGWGADEFNQTPSE